jgi:hypothetical protein
VNERLLEKALRAAAEAGAGAAPGAAVATELSVLDTQHPWLGLASFTEETRAWFHGREEEVAELSRRVTRKTLTVLFGQSGLGKTSILRAGLVPRLAPQGYCPVYVRIDYGRDAPAPAEQIKQAIFRATEGTGAWTRAGVAVPGESLWEFLHHRGDILQDAEGQPVIPLLIFDQFEEMFTLGQTDEAGRARAAQFIAELADLVENRPPRDLEARMDADEGLTERFDFARADYRVLIALREDYLAHLESVKGAMPSITQNRMRLARMTGDQALAAVVRPGGRLVTQEVAEAIVRFIAGGAELRNAEVEPSLLSLICRELNNARIAQRRDEISADLLAGSHDTILAEFYERALADQPASVRKVIEDELLTDSGFRENVAEERLAKAFAAAGAAPDAIAVLVNRRLLRIEERLDVRRVELTHDVLCGVVKASRAARLEREARDHAERELVAQRVREAATRQALVRARWIAGGCAVLALGAAVSAFFAYESSQRAREAEALAQRSGESAQKARGEAEKLVVYLLDDFFVELEPVGRLDLVGDLAARALAYYSGLPAELRSGETERNRALALVRLGFVQRSVAKFDEAERTLTEAVAILAKARAAGDASESSSIGHSLGLSFLGRVHESKGSRLKALPVVEEAERILAQRAAAPGASVAVRRAYGTVTNYLGYLQVRTGKLEDGIRTLEGTRATYEGIDGLKLGDLGAAAAYAEATGWLMDALELAGRMEESRKVGQEAAQVASRVLEKRPGHMQALRSRALILSGLARNFGWSLEPGRALQFARAGAADWEALTRVDPGNNIAWGNLAVSRFNQGISLWNLGRDREAAAMFRGTAQLGGPGGSIAQNALSHAAFQSGWAAYLAAEHGDRAVAAADMARGARFTDAALVSLAPDAFPRKISREHMAQFDSMIAWALGDVPALRENALTALTRLEALQAAARAQEDSRTDRMAMHFALLAYAAYGDGDFAGAEKAARSALAARKEFPPQNDGRWLELAENKALLALALARQGRLAFARDEIGPIRGELARRGIAARPEPIARVSVALILFAAAVSTPQEAPALFAESLRHLDAMPAEARQRQTVQRLRAWIVEERKKLPA